jgi:hypothetical protein
MSLSLLMYALMVVSLLTIVGVLAADAVRSRVRNTRPVRVATASRYDVGRLQHR